MEIATCPPVATDAGTVLCPSELYPQHVTPPHDESAHAKQLAAATAICPLCTDAGGGASGALGVVHRSPPVHSTPPRVVSPQTSEVQGRSLETAPAMAV
jgi:hypothetical protein